MNAIRRRFIEARVSESGLSLIEVIIAMMVFAMIATGVGYTMLASLNLTKDSSARQQAANLAAQEIDLSRAIDNLFNLDNNDRVLTINGVTFTIQRRAQWVSDPTVDQRCGLGGGILRYKRVNVTVVWDGFGSNQSSVRADTLIDPGVRINDPDLGTILVAATDSSGSPVAGATVSVNPATPPDGAQALASQPAVTDSQGCTYALLVNPGNYDVTVSKSGYVDINQNSAPSMLVSVDASSAAAVEVDLDLGGTFPLDYATNFSGTPDLPANLGISFVNTYGTYIETNAPSSVTLYPFPAGYQVLSGVYNDPGFPANFCKAVDPAEWAAGVTDSVNYAAGVRPDAVATVPGGTAAVANIPMGVLTVTMPNWSSGSDDRYLVAIAQSSGPVGAANPGCDVPQIYYFSERTKNSASTIALPFGSWKLYASSNTTATSSRTDQVSTSRIIPLTAAQLRPSGDIVTLDPRVVNP